MPIGFGIFVTLGRLIWCIFGKQVLGGMMRADVVEVTLLAWTVTKVVMLSSTFVFGSLEQRLRNVYVYLDNEPVDELMLVDGDWIWRERYTTFIFFLIAEVTLSY
jgi:hypothetical protein